MNSPEPIIGNDFVEEAETFVHSVLGDVLIQHLVVPGGGDNHDDTGGDSDNGDAFNKKCSLACSSQEENHENVREAVDPGNVLWQIQIQIQR